MQNVSLDKKKFRFKSRTVLGGSVTALTFIMSCTVNSGIFAAVCKKMDSYHRQMLLHALICFLSWETVQTSPF